MAFFRTIEPATMLAHTFCHIPRISLNKERTLWEQGILTWDDYRPIAKDSLHLDASLEHLLRRQPSFFADSMKSDQHWRLFGDFREELAYIDIETTGLSKDYCQITTIALYDGHHVRSYVNGRNLEQFCQDIGAYKLLVSFNGACFDLPFINKFFNIRLPHVHIDLRYVLNRLGFSGGLKRIEHLMGLDRGDLRDVDGFLAVRLWHEYQRTKNEAALETLLAYNCADVINLEQLMIQAYNMNVHNTPFADAKTIANTQAPKNPHQSDARLLERLSY